jgi:hypothetical protein
MFRNILFLSSMPMRSLSLPVLAVMMAMPLAQLLAVDTPASEVPAEGAVTAVTTSTTESPTSSEAMNAAPTTTTGTAATTSTTPVVTATQAPPMAAVAGSSLGEYKSVSCNSNSAFAVNNCDQCFDGGSVKVGVRLTGLFDNWTNNTTTPLTAYKDEQKTPNMVRFGNTTWTTTPATEAGVWKYSSDVLWSSGSTKSSFILSPGSKVKFYEADLNAGYTLEKTDKKNGELVGLLRFPVVSRVTNIQTATEGTPSTHYECVAYKLDAPAPVVETPKPTETPAPPVEKMTKTETGPETLLLIAAAFFIAFGLMFTLRKRV